ncbi:MULTISPECIES: methyltransferase domain-containing protein [unclassified Streptomyces]|uniref:methyltransferase domain-containing protein n=1 Tax=unclassified Streptomyces TaxID=2593676 RepID=UPI000CD5C681|nr:MULTISPECIES: methyltransferase domain-containing protein [unclassified Streptomyces]
MNQRLGYDDPPEARRLRAALADELAAGGDLRSDDWRAAFEDTPRHLYVPVFHRQTADGWRRVAAGEDGHLAAVYSDTALTTQLTDGAATSSSSQPGLMAQMLEALDVRDGDHVAEVATGSGYNAALLCHRLGDDNVASVEVDRELSELARDRLAAAGLAPALLVGDAREGFPGDAVFDRMIVTCGLPCFPHALAHALRPGGVVVAPLGTGNVRLVAGASERDGEPPVLEGRFLRGGSYFMTARAPGTTGTVPYPGEPADAPARDSGLDLAEAARDGFAFVRTLMLGETGEATELDGSGRPVAVRLWARDGSWAHVAGAAGGGGTVREDGPRRLWAEVEAAHAWFTEHDRPARERFGVTVTARGEQIWLDDPAQPLRPAHG